MPYDLRLGSFVREPVWDYSSVDAVLMSHGDHADNLNFPRPPFPGQPPCAQHSRWCEQPPACPGVVRFLPWETPPAQFGCKFKPEEASFSNISGELTVFVAQSDSDSFGIIESSSPLHHVVQIIWKSCQRREGSKGANEVCRLAQGVGSPVH